MTSSRLKFLVDVGVGKKVELFLLENATGSEKQEVIANILAKHSSDIVNRYCVFQNGKLRIRKIGR